MKKLLLLASLAACGGPLVPYPEPQPQQQALTGAVVEDCAPNDGPALVFNLDGDAPACGVSFKKLSVSLWKKDPAVGTYELGGTFDHDGYAAACGAEECFQSTTGTFVIDAVDLRAVSGHYDVTLVNGEKRSGAFNVQRCAGGTRLCG